MKRLSLAITPKANRFSPEVNSELASPTCTAPTVLPSSRSVWRPGDGKSEAETSWAARTERSNAESRLLPELGESESSPPHEATASPRTQTETRARWRAG